MTTLTTNATIPEKTVLLREELFDYIYHNATVPEKALLLWRLDRSVLRLNRLEGGRLKSDREPDREKLPAGVMEPNAPSPAESGPESSGSGLGLGLGLKPGL